MTRKKETVSVVSLGDMDYDLRDYPYPGKYEGGLAIDEYVHRLTMDGSDEEAGDVTEVGEWAGLLRGPLKEAKEIASEEGDVLLGDEEAFLRAVAGAIVTENDQGFVDVTYYATKDELEEAWEETVEELERVSPEE